MRGPRDLSSALRMGDCQCVSGDVPELTVGIKMLKAYRKKGNHVGIKVLKAYRKKGIIGKPIGLKLSSRVVWKLPLRGMLPRLMDASFALAAGPVGKRCRH